MKLLLPVLLPILAGIFVLVSKGLRKDRKWLTGFSVFALAVEAALVILAVLKEDSVTLLSLTSTMTIAFRVDAVSRLFAVLTAVMWLFVGIYAVAYMKHEHEEHQFFGYYLIVIGVLAGLDF